MYIYTSKCSVVDQLGELQYPEREQSRARPLHGRAEARRRRLWPRVLGSPGASHPARRFQLYLDAVGPACQARWVHGCWCFSGACRRVHGGGRVWALPRVVSLQRRRPAPAPGAPVPVPRGRLWATPSTPVPWPVAAAGRGGPPLLRPSSPCGVLLFPPISAYSPLFLVLSAPRCGPRVSPHAAVPLPAVRPSCSLLPVGWCHAPALLLPHWTSRSLLRSPPPPPAPHHSSPCSPSP